MRGIRIRRNPAVLRPGISPAHAGNTYRLRSLHPCSTDQPRTCGEYSRGVNVCDGVGGSAPHMRGIPKITAGKAWAIRISPAHAGNTRDGGIPRLAMWDQPRTCGEYNSRAASKIRRPGSAPHMRGIQGAGSADCRSQGDQPRTCGEYSPWSAPACVSRGSAPHMRGIPVTRPSVLGIRGISPAHAGNTVAVSFVSPGIWDQPRTCGEYKPIS